MNAAFEGPKRSQLDSLYREVHDVILVRQHPISGLLPASTAVNSHGDYRHAWVRDNVYSIMAVWGLALAYRKLGDDGGRGYELEHAVVNLMRGLLRAMMQQAAKVEAFKGSLDPFDALHAKYDTATGNTVMGDDAWGHLQLDATSLYLLMLAQMTASGLTLIYSEDEVNFVQNLVFYIGRAYRTPDYGIWERGDKTNLGTPELNASSVALAKAALEALSGFNLYGVRGAQASVIHVLPDDIARSQITLEALLPRESSSKEVDAALLSAISFPAFAVDDPELVARTRETILEKLSGRYGLKRFLRDGHQTVLEHAERLHYEPEELERFEHIESEWPLFWTYLVLDGVFSGDRTQAEHYRARLGEVSVQRGGHPLLPELFYVPAQSVAAERAQPGSQTRVHNANVPLVWAQSLKLLGEMLLDGHLSVFDIDPLARHQRTAGRARPTVQLALVAEDAVVQRELADRGVRAETLEQVRPLRLQRATELTDAYHQIGRNDKLGLSGRGVRRLQTISTSRIFRLAGEEVVCPPAFFDQQEFYLSLDPDFLVRRFRAELVYLHRYWSGLGRPTLTLYLTRDLLESSEDALFGLMAELRSGSCQGVPVKVAPLGLLAQTAAFERIDNLHDFRLADPTAPGPLLAAHPLHFERERSRPLTPDEAVALELTTDPAALRARLKASRNLFEQAEILSLCAERCGLEHDLGDDLGEGGEAGGTVRVWLEEVYRAAGELRLWAVVRRAAGLLGKVDVALSDSLTDLLVRQKTVMIGRAYSKRSLITQPLPQPELLDKIREFCRDDIRDRVLTQELIVYLGLLIRAEPHLFRDFISVRVGHLILLLVSDLARREALTQDSAYERLLHLSPAHLQAQLREVLRSYSAAEQHLKHQEAIQVQPGGAPGTALSYTAPSAASYAVPAADEDPWRWRQREGTLSRVPSGFYPAVWQLLRRCRGLVIGDKLERRNRLESRPLLAEMTPGETKFALRVEHLLSKIPSPEYRQLSVEALAALSDLFRQNRALAVDDHLVLDVIIGHAVRLGYLDAFPEREAHYDHDRAAAWAHFYARPPLETRGYLVASFSYLVGSGAAQLERS